MPIKSLELAYIFRNFTVGQAHQIKPIFIVMMPFPDIKVKKYKNLIYKNQEKMLIKMNKFLINS